MSMDRGRPKRRHRIDSTTAQFDSGGTNRDRHVIEMAACHQASAHGSAKEALSLRAMTSQIDTNDRTTVSPVNYTGACRHSTAPGCLTEASS